MNWGKGIAIAIASFMIFILVLVFTLMSKSAELESDDYYKQELEFENEIQAMNNANNLSEKVDIKSNGEYLTVQFPSSGNVSKMIVELKRPNDKKLDKIYKLSDSKLLTVPSSELTKGVYEIKVFFKKDGKECLTKSSIKI